MRLRTYSRLIAMILGLGALPLSASGQGELGQWITRAPMITPRQEMPNVVLDGRIYLVGGFNEFGAATPLVEAYEPATDKWYELASLPLWMHHTAIAAANGKLYVLGGYVNDGFTASDRVFAYDPTTDTWEEKSSMPTARGAHVAVTVGDKIYVIGGEDINGPVGSEYEDALATHELYDPATDSWTKLAPMPTPREHLAAAAIDGQIYVVGGRRQSGFSLTNRRILERYDPATDMWTSLAPMLTARGGLAAAALYGKLYVFGGEYFTPTGRGVFAQNEEYDPATDQWRAMAPMPLPRHGFGAVAVGDTIYVIGGGPQAGYSVSETNSGYIPPRPMATPTEADRALPQPFQLYQNHPNPVAGTTRIRFTIPQSSEVTLTIYDLLGREIATPAQGSFGPGDHEVTWHAAEQAGGVYLYRLMAGGFSQTRSLVLLNK